MTSFDHRTPTRERFRAHAADNERHELELEVYIIQRLIDANEPIPTKENPHER